MSGSVVQLIFSSLASDLLLPPISEAKSDGSRLVTLVVVSRNIAS